MFSLIWRDGEEPTRVGHRIWPRPAGRMDGEMLVRVAPAGRGAEMPHKARRVGEPRGSEDGSPLLLLLLRWAEAQGSGVLG